MKRIIFFIVCVLFIIFGFPLVKFVYDNAKGVEPAVLPVPKITSHPSVSENTTGLPLTVSPGFSISAFADHLVGPRVVTFDPNGVLLASITATGEVVALPDTNGDGKADTKKTVISGLDKPHGLAFDGGTLYIAEENAVAMYDYNGSTFLASNRKKILDLPTGGNHFTRTIAFGPDHKLYIAIGSTCNVCYEKDARRAKIFVSNSDGSDFHVFASGLRNTVFFTWHPTTGEMWGNDMGRDLIGDDIPPDEINIIKEGNPSTGSGPRFYGWPNCYGQKILDTTFDASPKARELCSGSEPSYIDLPAHSAPLGLAFVPDFRQTSLGSKTVNKLTTGNIKAVFAWPDEYQNNLLVSYHGSWNRTVPTGYKIVRIKLDAKGNYLGIEDFISGWLDNGRSLGRPVDLVFDAQGNLFVSDDKAGVIYRVSP